MWKLTITACKVQDRAPNGVIALNELLFATTFVHNGNMNYNWKHWECIGSTQEENARKRFNIHNVHELEGYGGLNDVDKAQVDALLRIARPFKARNRTTGVPNGNGSASVPNSARPSPPNQGPFNRNTSTATPADPSGPKSTTMPTPPPKPERIPSQARRARRKRNAFGAPPAPAPAPAPKAKATPASAPETAPTPEPKPNPKSTPTPASASAFKPTPTPTPKPASTPAPEPAPSTPMPGAEFRRNPPRPNASMSAEELRVLGNLYFRYQMYEVAIDIYGKAIARKPDPVFYTNRAAAHMALKSFKSALDDCQVAELLQNHDPSSKTLGRLAKCHLALGDYDPAIRAAQKAIDCDPFDPTHPARLTKVTAELMREYIVESRQEWQKKCWVESKGRLAEATALCEGDCPPQWLVWGIQIEMAKGEWEAATGLVEVAESLHQASTDIQVASAHVALLTDQIPSGLASLRAALRRDPEHPLAGTLLRRMKGIDQARQEGDRLAVAAMHVEASSQYSEALSLLGCDEEEGLGGNLRFILLGNRADAYFWSKSFDLARDDCQAALFISNHPSPLKILNRLADCYVALGDPTTALQYIEEALKLDPLDSDMAKTKLSAEHMQTNIRESREAWSRKDWLEAKGALRQATIACSGERPLQWGIWEVEIEMTLGSWNDAVCTAEVVVGSYPTSAHAFAISGLALMLSNKLALSMEHLGSAIRLDAENPLGISTLRRVQEIERTKEEGNQSFKFGRYPEAVSKYTETLTIIGDREEEGGGGYIRAVLLANRATALFKMERHARALTDITASLELQPISFKALRTHARVRAAQGYYDEAIKIYTRAQEIGRSGDTPSAETQTIVEELLVAETALTMSQSKDYHEILNIAKGASETEVKKAYRRSSLLFHPDKGGNPEHFKLVSEAYNALCAQS
ncbi:hypothetical protein FRB96_006764 [Tulasnella sp. 330]|nr:hypothetical protein FRB96_006764 [Tulasnella sp. 330]